MLVERLSPRWSSTGLTPFLGRPGQCGYFCATPTGERLATAYDLACNGSHTRRIFSGIGFGACGSPFPGSEPYHLATAALYKVMLSQLSTNTYKSKTESVTVQISSKANSSISLCEMTVFAKDDKWCEQPPENSVPNGQLEVSHSKAVLHCKEGFREKDVREVYATCENNTWLYLNLECVEDVPTFIRDEIYDILAAYGD
ncbi:hypothetical protein AVEN_83716-1 [Araneus ventricosus]|uniref:Sushi domain-containing protein n=1 Tax=Araneus ventricosus TaxID=182803 RepID=A0A4Y2EU58_ARAVE|nr:hypothetical protein AVEN_83716-1 [Araneus ventricosus]